MRASLCAMVVSIVVATGCGGERAGGVADRSDSDPADALQHASSVITEQMLREDVTRLASDDFEGRGPGTKGDRAARAYLASRLEGIGCEPAFAGRSWEQAVEIVGLTTEAPAQWVFRSGSGRTAAFAPRLDFVADIGVQQPAVAIDGAEVVFVGYGITAPEEDWDDFKGADVSGKVLLMLNDDPDWDPGLFEGERRLYYGRWVYKYESAAAHGAAAAIIIHTDESAGYPWAVVQTGSAGEQFELPAAGEPRLAVRSWMTEGAVRELVALGGHDLDSLIAAARSRDFEPVPLGVTTSIELTAEIRTTETANVGGLLRGSDPPLADQAVVISAHHDHFGIGEPDDTGDRIYNGALDNGVAMAQALAVAEAAASLPKRPRRSFLFLFVAAEEQGILGSLYYTRNPSFPPGKLAADINFELGNVWGPTRDVTIFGRGKSTLEDLLEEAAAVQGRVVVGESTPRAGWYYRSDQFSFARIGVPAIWFKSGTDFIGRPEGWGDARYAEWIEERYHRPSDEVEDWWNFEGLAEDAQLAFTVAVEVANADQMPTWYPGDEFEDEREAALAAVD
jgi:Zn-dependent M28 family amino/carboxypeptidase